MKSINTGLSVVFVMSMLGLVSVSMWTLLILWLANMVLNVIVVFFVTAVADGVEKWLAENR